MHLSEIVKEIANILKDYDSEKPKDNERYRPGIGSLREDTLVKIIAERLKEKKHPSCKKVHPDLDIEDEWAIEFKLARPFNDNGSRARINAYNIGW